MKPTNGWERKRAERFWSYVEKTGDDYSCWTWRGVRNPRDPKRHRGALYGIVALHECGRRRRMHAHKFAWILTHGEVPEGMFVCHHCDNPSCVRPDHLFLGTPKDNSQDMKRKGRHAHGPEHGLKCARARKCPKQPRQAYVPRRWKLTPDVTARILARRAEGATYKALCAEFGIAENTVAKLVREQRAGQATSKDPGDG